MKKVILSAFTLASVALVSCGGGETTETNTTDEAATNSEVVETVTYVADASNSDVNWKGEVVGVYGHEGIIEMQSGEVMVEGDQIVGGTFVIDMNTIWPTDSASYKDEEGRRATDLVGHLSTDDFFSIDEYPTSTFVIKSVDGNTITGDLTVKGQTHEETLEVDSLEMTEDGMMMSGTLVFDRQKYGVSWEHFVKDYVLSDDIVVMYNVVAKK